MLLQLVNERVVNLSLALKFLTREPSPKSIVFTPEKRISTSLINLFLLKLSELSDI